MQNKGKFGDTNIILTGDSNARVEGVFWEDN